MSWKQFCPLLRELKTTSLFSSLVIHFVHFMTAPFFSELKTFILTVIQQCQQPKWVPLHKYDPLPVTAQACFVIFYKEIYVSANNAPLPLFLDPFVDLAILNRKPVSLEAQCNEQKRIQLCPVSP